MVLTWPLVTHLSTAVSDLGDPLLNTWILDWDCYGLTHQPLHLFDAPIFYPSKFPLAYSENLLGIALLCLPFRLAGASPVAIHGIATLIGFALAAYGASVLGRVVTQRFWPSALAGVLYGFVPYRFMHLAHVQVVSAGWLPLLLAALLAYRRSPTRLRAALFALAFVMNGLTNIYFLLFGAVAAGLTMVLIAIAEPRDSRFWLRLGAALLIAIVVLVPVLIPYQVVSDLYRLKRGAEETAGGSATWTDWLIAPWSSALYHRITDPDLQQNERQLFPGALMLFLAAAAFFLVRGRERPAATASSRSLFWLDAIIVALALVTYAGVVASNVRIIWHRQVLLDFGRAFTPAMLLAICIVIRFAIRLPGAFGGGNLRTAIAGSRFSFEMIAAGLWIGIGVIGSLGLNTFFHSFLFHHILPFRAIRVPARWAAVAYTGLAAWSAAGASMFRRRWVLPLFFVLAFVEVRPRIRWEHALPEPADADRWLAQTHAGPLIELPINNIQALYFYLLRSTAHHVPIVDGISGFEPPLHRTLREQPLTDATYTLLEQNGCHYVLMRPEWFGGQAPDAMRWIERGIAEGRLAFVRRFDGGINGDWLFALTRVEKNWQRFRVPSDDVQFALLASGKMTFNHSTFGQLYQPRMNDEIKGTMTVSGWALSPYGIREVNVLISDGRVRVPAGLFAREDVSRMFPYYPQTPRPAFATRISARPPGVPQETELQIEIIDGRGKRTMLPDVRVDWH